jgi:hypothetical protein
MWRYQSRTDIGSGMSSFSETAADVVVGSFHRIITGAAMRTEAWSCRSEGLRPLDFEGSVYLTGRSGWTEASHRTDTVDGIAIARDLRVGASWTLTYQISGMGTFNMTSITYTEQVTRTYTVAAEESLTVPAGTFQALRVDVKGSVSSQIANAGAIQNFQINAPSSIWFAPGVGRVREQQILSQNGQGYTLITELVGFTPGS